MGYLRKLRFANGGGVGIVPDPQFPGGTPPPSGPAEGRQYNAYGGDYYTYGERPEHQFFTGQLPKAQISPGSGLPTPAAPPKQSNTSGNIQQALLGVPMLGKTAATLGDVLQGFGMDNAFTQGLEKYGNMVANPIKTAVDWYKGQGNFADYGSGNPLDAALAEKGITSSGASPAVEGALAKSGILDKSGQALGAASDLYGIYQGIDQGGVQGYGQAAKGAADLAGYDVPALGYVDAVGRAFKGDVGGAGVSAASTAAGPLAAAGFLAAGLLDKQLNAHGDEKRNLQQFLTDNPLGLTGYAQSGAMSRGIPPLSGYMTADGRLLTDRYIQDLAGAYYGSKYAPDGNQADWKSKYDALFSSPEVWSSPYGGGSLFKWENGRFVRSDNKNIDTYINDKKVARGGRMSAQHGNLGKMLVEHFSTGSGQNYVEGPGTGRSDEIPAQLSDGEYVMDAETVALLGDGSSDAGARKLDELRENIRKHKGKNLAKGKFSANAKDPVAYLGRS